MVELVDGRVMLNARDIANKHFRLVATSNDGGETWTKLQQDPNLFEPPTSASILRYTDPLDSDRNRILFANPASSRDRIGMTIRLSYNEGHSWSVAKVINPSFSSYSCLTVLQDRTIGFAYETGDTELYQHIRFVGFTLDWLKKGADTISHFD